MGVNRFLTGCACIVSEKHYHSHMSATSKPVSDKAELEAGGRQCAPLDSSVRPSVPCVKSQELFGRTREILIEHAGAYYRLRLTHSNKLILTK